MRRTPKRRNYTMVGADGIRTDHRYSELQLFSGAFVTYCRNRHQVYTTDERCPACGIAKPYFTMEELLTDYSRRRSLPELTPQLTAVLTAKGWEL